MAYTPKTDWATGGSLTAADVNRIEGGVKDSLGGAGTLAARPAASAVAAGYIYFATDDNGGTAYRSNGTAWVKVAASVLQSGGAELGYAEVQANFSQVATVNTVYAWAGMTITVAVGSRPVLVEAYCGQAVHSVAAADISMLIYEDGALVATSTITSPATNKGGVLRPAGRRSPAAGNHTYDVRMKTTTAGTVTGWAGAGYPAWIRAVEG